MSQKLLTAALGSLLAVSCLAGTGCVTTQGPYLGVLSFPIPVSPYYQKKQEDEFWWHERYARAPILGPITAGGPAVALDPPSDDEVRPSLSKAPSTEEGIPFAYAKNRNNVRITKELIADYIDPPRVYPLIGPAQLHHAHYKCTVYFEEVTRVGWPMPHTLRDEDSVEVIYIDHNHLHMVGNVDTGPGSNY